VDRLYGPPYNWSDSYNAFLWQIRQIRIMKTTSAILPMLLLSALAASAAEPESAADLARSNAPSSAPQGGYEAAPGPIVGDQLLAQSLEGLARQGTLTAKVGLKAELFGQQLAGTGTYSQQSGEGASQYASRQPDSIVGIRLRLELRIARPNQAASGLLYVGDGRNLWMYEEIGEQPKLSRIDVWRVRDAIDSAGPSRASPTKLLTLGGLPKLIAGLRGAFDFAEVREGTLGTTPVWVLDGLWKREQLVRLLPDQKESLEAGQKADLTKLARQVPASVQLVLGKDDLLPYRLEYRRVTKKNKDGDDADPGNWQSLLVLEFFEFDRNPQLEDRLFEYQPNSIEVVDQTDEFLKSLGLTNKPPR
jgi:hypothetical protein